MRQRRIVQVGKRYISEERFVRFRLTRHEIYGLRRQLRIDAAARFEIVDVGVLRRLAFHARHHVRQRHHIRIKTRRTREHAFVGSARYAVPFVEAAVLRVASFLVAQVPFAEACGGVAAARYQLRERDFPRDEALRQARRHRLQCAGTYRMAPRHQRRARRHAVGFHVEVEASQPFFRQRVDARRGRSAQRAATVTAELTPAEIVGEDQNDIRRLRVRHGLSIVVVWRELRSAAVRRWVKYKMLALEAEMCRDCLLVETGVGPGLSIGGCRLRTGCGDRYLEQKNFSIAYTNTCV